VALGAALRALHSPETLTGIVDWVDVCSSDPAVDLSVAWSSLDEARRPAFFTAYGAFLCAMLADWARKEQVTVVLDAAVAGLVRATEEP